ncbi:MAG: hypothetical protein WCJ72_03600, partial [Chryseobacterium sp.]
IVFSVFSWYFFSLSRDSYDYISLANHIKEGKFYSSNNEYSTVWPLGYSILVAAVSYLGLPLKLSLLSINLILFISSYKLLAKVIEGEDNNVLSILILFIFHGIYLRAISEPLFIFLIIAILFVLKNFEYNFKNYCILTVLFWFLVETKHAGIFMIPCSLLYLNGLKINKQSFFLILTTSLLLVIFILRLYFIGNITGEHRIPNSDSLLSVIKGSLDISNYHEFKKKYHPYFISILLLGACSVYFRRSKDYPKYLLFIFLLAIFYYCYIVLLRYITFFSGLEPRFMVPYVLFSMIFILSVLKGIKKYFITISIIIFGVSLYINIKYKYKINYENNIFNIAFFEGKTEAKNVVVDRKSSVIVAEALFSGKNIIIQEKLKDILLINNNKDSLYYGNGSVFLIKTTNDTVKIIDLTLNKNLKK